MSAASGRPTAPQDPGDPSSSRPGPPDDSLPTGQAKAATVQGMFDRIAGRYDALNRMLTFGMDVLWRRRAVRSLELPSGARVLDVACGTGDLCRELASAGYRPVGVDFAYGMLQNARTSAPLVQADALKLPVAEGSVSGITCGFALRNVTDLAAMFAEMARVVHPGGRVAILEVAEPSNRLLRSGHSVYFNRVVPFVGGLVSDRAAYRYLPRSVAYLPPPSELVGILGDAGFGGAQRVELSGGIAQLLVGTRR